MHAIEVFFKVAPLWKFDHGLPMFEIGHEISVVTKAVCKPVRTCNSQGQLRLFTAPCFFVRSSGSSAYRYERPSWFHIYAVPRGREATPKPSPSPYNIWCSLHPRWPPVTQSARSYGKIGDCEQFRVKLAAHTLVSFFTSFLHQIRHPWLDSHGH